MPNAPAPSNRFIPNIYAILFVWTCWYFIGGDFAIQSLVNNWVISVTMIFGSMMSGGTSEGSGALSFPVFTKVLHIPAADARTFALATQSIGMGSASIYILRNRIPVEWRILPWAASAGIVGITLSTFFIAPHVPTTIVKISFTVMVSVLAIALLIMNSTKNRARHERIPVFNATEKTYLVLAGLLGGIMSGLVGCGENIITFTILVLLFRLSEKVATPTTVLLMTIVVWAGFALHAFGVKDFSSTIQSYWLAAAPVVVVGAPIGAYLCSKLTKESIAYILIGLISLELLSTIILVPMTAITALTALATLGVFGALIMYMCRVDIYCPRKKAAGYIGQVATA